MAGAAQQTGGVVVDRRGNLYIADIANNVVRRMDRQGMLSTFAGDSTFGYQGDGHSAVQARFNEIYGIGIDWKGEVLFVADYYNHCIRQIDLQSQRIETIAGKGIAGYEGDGAAPDCALLKPAGRCMAGDLTEQYILRNLAAILCGYSLCVITKFLPW